MKTKNKMLAMLEIAIVLCSAFLMAIPAIAAEQNQEMQGVSANTITTASEDDYVLGVYGNANEDDTIDMRDLTYVKLIFFGKKPETELSDAKYDGKINPLDFIQIKLIIVGKEKEITIIDHADRIVTVNMPVERVYIYSDYYLETIRIFGAKDKIAALSQYCFNQKGYFPKFNELPVFQVKDYEAILSFSPDLVTTGVWSGRITVNPEKLPSIPIVAFSLTAKKSKPKLVSRRIRETWLYL